MEIKYKCAKCGCPDIQIRAWVNINTNEYIEDCDDGEYWCPDCEEYVDVVKTKE